MPIGGFNNEYFVAKITNLKQGSNHPLIRHSNIFFIWTFILYYESYWIHIHDDQ